MKKRIVSMANQLIQNVGHGIAFNDYQRGYYSALNDLSVLVSGEPLEPTICAYDGCNNYFIDIPSGKARQYCSNSHRVMAWRKRQKA